MSDLLIQGLVDHLLGLSTVEKEVIGSRLVEALGGDPTKRSTGLPQRRGNQDGGLDGRIPVYRTIIGIQAVLTDSGREEVFRRSEPEFTEVLAGVTVKIEKQTFSRTQLGGFKMDLEREGLPDGVIITAAGLARDAKVEIDRLNRETGFRMIAPTLGDLLAQRIPDSPIEFVVNPNDAIRIALSSTAT